MNKKIAYTFTIPLEEIYPNGYTVPPGWEFVDFTPPKSSESYLDINDGKTIRYAIGDGFRTHPRIIVRPKPKQKRYVFELADTQLGLSGLTTLYRRNVSDGNMQPWSGFPDPAFGPYYTCREEEI